MVLCNGLWVALLEQGGLEQVTFWDPVQPQPLCNSMSCTIQIGAQQVYSLRWDQTYLKFWSSCNNFFLHHVVLWKIYTNLLVCPHLNVLNNFKIRIEIIFLVMIFWGDSDTSLKRSRYWDRYIHIDIYPYTLLGIGDFCLVYFLISGITFWNNKRESRYSLLKHQTNATNRYLQYYENIEKKPTGQFLHHQLLNYN